MDFKPYIESFLPLFVAIDVIGILPIFVGVTQGMAEKDRNRLAMQATLAALVLAMLILFTGELIFKALGITLNDLRIGGGLVLLILSINDLLFSDLQRRNPADEKEYTIGVVPIGIPLMMGPSALTTIMVSQQNFGYLPALISLVLNLLIVLVVFHYGVRLLNLMGSGATKAIAKVISLFMTAIAVAMIRAGITGILGG